MQRMRTMTLTRGTKSQEKSEDRRRSSVLASHSQSVKDRDINYYFFSLEEKICWCYCLNINFLCLGETEDRQKPRYSCSTGSRIEWWASLLSHTRTILFRHSTNIFASLMKFSSPTSLSRSTAPPFLMRSRAKAIRVNGRVLSISFQGESLLRQLSLIGGNKTGVFVHQVTEGSPAHTVGISPGAQIVEVGIFSSLILLPVRRLLSLLTLMFCRWNMSRTRSLWGWCWRIPL